jgi:hypothetical protein
MRRIRGMRGAGEMKGQDRLATTRRTRFSWSKTFFLICSIGTFVFFAFAGGASAMRETAATAPSIVSDQADYKPGSVVTLTGANWGAGESVQIVTNDTAGQTWSQTDNVTADANGDITDQLTLPNTFISDYTVVATGAVSGTAQTTFTDAAPASITSNPPALTNSTTASFTFSVNGNSGVQFQCRLDAAAYANCTVSASNPGSQSYSGLAAGSHTFRVRNGTSGADDATYTWTIDTTAPSIPSLVSPANNASTNNATPTFSWSSVSDPNGVTYTLQYGPKQMNCSAASFTTTQSGLTSTSFTPGSNLSDGTYCWRVEAVDGASNESGYSSARTLMISSDSTPPAISYTLNPNSPDGQNNWYKSNVSLTWTVSEPESPGSLVKTGCVDQNITTDQQATTYSCSATSLGGSAGPVSVTIKRDGTIPSVTLDGLPPSTTNATIDVSGTASDATSGVASVAVNGSPATFTPPSFSRLAVPLSCGSNTIKAVSTDAAGNSSAEATASVTRICDAAAPVITIATDAGDTVAGSGWYNIASSGTDGVKVLVSVNDPSGVASLSCTDGVSTVLSKTYSPVGSPKIESFTLTDGTHSISCAATDGIGNGPGVGSGSTAMPVSYKVDETAPNISGSAAPAANGAGWNGTDVTVSFSCSDATSTINTCPSPTTLSGDGAGQFASGTATDKAGNTASATVSGINIDKTAPTITASATVEGGGAYTSGDWTNKTVTVHFTCDDTLSGFTSGACPADVVVNSDTAAAGQNVSGNVADKAGNGATSNTINVKVDTAAPTATLASRLPAANADGWNNSDVTVKWDCADGLSGPKVAQVSDTKSSDGANQTASATCEDKAGNTKGASLGGINIDTAAPTISASRTPAANGDGWNNGDVTVQFSCGDPINGETASGVASCPADVTLTGEGANQSVTRTVFDKAGNSASATQGNINIDKTDPVAMLASRLPAANAAGWNNTDVTVKWNCTDALSGPKTTQVSDTKSTEGANQTASASCEDKAGNTKAGSLGGIKIDKTPPVLVNMPPDKAVAATSATGATVGYTNPTATDNLDPSPSVGCAPTSGSLFPPDLTTVTCSSTDQAGNTKTATFKVTVGFTFNGFLQPVDNNKALNGMKAGSTAPMKWQVPNGSGGYIADLSIVKSETSGVVACTSGVLDPLEEYATGGTSLRYDSTSNQFIYNWQSPRKAGTCYIVNIGLSDGTVHSALFQLN